MKLKVSFNSGVILTFDRVLEIKESNNFITLRFRVNSEKSKIGKYSFSKKEVKRNIEISF